MIKLIAFDNKGRLLPSQSNGPIVPTLCTYSFFLANQITILYLCYALICSS